MIGSCLELSRSPPERSTPDVYKRRRLATTSTHFPFRGGMVIKDGGHVHLTEVKIFWKR